MGVSNAILQMLLNKAKNDPSIANNPVAQNMIQAIETGDEAMGRQIAENLCRTNGVTPQEALGQATKFFNV